MLAAGWVGLFAGCLPPLRGKLEIAMLAAYGAAAGMLYGAITNLWFWPFETSGLSPQISYVPGASWVTEVHHYAAFYVATSVGWDLTRAIGNAVLVAGCGPRGLARTAAGGTSRCLRPHRSRSCRPRRDLPASQRAAIGG